jgi:hypothetical protein
MTEPVFPPKGLFVLTQPSEIQVQSLYLQLPTLQFVMRQPARLTLSILEASPQEM